MHFLNIQLGFLQYNDFQLIFKRCPGHCTCTVTGARIKGIWEAKEEVRTLKLQSVADMGWGGSTTERLCPKQKGAFVILK